jgi:RNA polymerase sigma factor (sigma-70 family)
MVYGLCRTLLRDAHEADDATQAAFVSAYRALLGGTQPREPAAWLATIARNECAARARARMREPLPLAETQIPHTPGPEAELERLNTVDELRAAIAGLPEKQREAVVLRDLYGLRYDEVGAALGMSVASVESLLFRARRRLRCSLKPLASGVLTVPLAVREGFAQAIPGFGTAAAPGGIGAGAAGAGMLAKLAGGPAAAKLAAGIAAAVAAGSVAVAKVEHPSRQSAIDVGATHVDAELPAPAATPPRRVSAAAALRRPRPAGHVRSTGRARPKQVDVAHRAVIAASAPVAANRVQVPSTGDDGSAAPQGPEPQPPTPVAATEGERGPGSTGQGNMSAGARGDRSGGRGEDDGARETETSHEGPGSGDDGGTTESVSSGSGGSDGGSAEPAEESEHSGSSGSGEGGSGDDGHGGSSGSGESGDSGSASPLAT